MTLTLVDLILIVNFHGTTESIGSNTPLKAYMHMHLMCSMIFNAGHLNCNACNLVLQIKG